jgi:hypothetical protein
MSYNIYTFIFFNFIFFSNAFNSTETVVYVPQTDISQKNIINQFLIRYSTEIITVSTFMIAFCYIINTMNNLLKKENNKTDKNPIDQDNIQELIQAMKDIIKNFEDAMNTISSNSNVENTNNIKIMQEYLNNAIEANKQNYQDNAKLHESISLLMPNEFNKIKELFSTIINDHSSSLDKIIREISKERSDLISNLTNTINKLSKNEEINPQEYVRALQEITNSVKEMINQNKVDNEKNQSKLLESINKLITEIHLASIPEKSINKNNDDKNRKENPHCEKLYKIFISIEKYINTKYFKINKEEEEEEEEEVKEQNNHENNIGDFVDNIVENSNKFECIPLPNLFNIIVNHFKVKNISYDDFIRWYPYTANILETINTIIKIENNRKSKENKETKISKAISSMSDNLSKSLREIENTLNQKCKLLYELLQANNKKEEENLAKEAQRIKKEKLQLEREVKSIEKKIENLQKKYGRIFQSVNFGDNQITLEKFKDNPDLEEFFEYYCNYNFNYENLLENFLNCFLRYFQEIDPQITSDFCQKSQNQETQKFIKNINKLSIAFINEKKLREKNFERSADFAYFNDYFLEDFHKTLKKIESTYQENKNNIIKYYDYEENTQNEYGRKQSENFASFIQAFEEYEILWNGCEKKSEEAKNIFFRKILKDIMVKSKDKMKTDLKKFELELTELKKELDEKISNIEKKLEEKKENFKLAENEYNNIKQERDKLTEERDKLLTERKWNEMEQLTSKINNVNEKINNISTKIIEKEKIFYQEQSDTKSTENDIQNLKNDITKKKLELQIKSIKKHCQDIENPENFANKIIEKFNEETKSTMKGVIICFNDYKNENQKIKRQRHYIKKLEKRFKKASSIKIPDGYQTLPEMEKFRDWSAIAAINKSLYIFEKSVLNNFTSMPHYLLYGDPGTGKTLALLNEAYTLNKLTGNQVYYIQFNPEYEKISDLLPMIKDYIKYVITPYEKESNKNTIFFIQIDEIDSMAKDRRTYDDSKNIEQTNLLLRFIDEINEFNRLRTENDNCSIQLYGTSNHLELIDPAVKRDGRMQPVAIKAPNATEKQFYFNTYYELIDKELFERICEHYTEFSCTDRCSHNNIVLYQHQHTWANILYTANTKYLHKGWLENFTEKSSLIKKIIINNKKKIKESEKDIIENSNTYINIRTKIDNIAINSMKHIYSFISKNDNFYSNLKYLISKEGEIADFQDTVPTLNKYEFKENN